MGGDRSSPAASRDGAGRRLHDRFPDGLCRAAAVEVPHHARRRACCARICYAYCGLALPPLRRGLCAQRERRRGQASLRSASTRSTSSRSGSRSASSARRAAIRGCAHKLGLADGQPLLVYVGRLDGEKKPDVVVDAFRRLPRDARRQAGADRRGAAQGRDRGARRRAHRHARLYRRPRRARPLAGERRHLRVRHGRRDVRRLDHRGAGVGPAGGRRRRRAR